MAPVGEWPGWAYNLDFARPPGQVRELYAIPIRDPAAGSAVVHTGNPREREMKKLFGSIGAFVASTAGWYATAKLGFMTAFVVSTVAGGFGLYYGVKWAREHLE